MPEQDVQAGEVDEAEEVLDVVFPSRIRAGCVLILCDLLGPFQLGVS
jgi:hypothetical protein